MTASDVYAVLLVAVPLGVGLLGLLLPRNATRPGAALGIGGATVALICAVLTAATSPKANASTNWVRFGSLRVTLGVHVEQPEALVAIAVAVVALAVQVYSVAYLAD